MHFVYKELATKKNDVGQIVRLVNVTKGFLHISGSLLIFDVRKLVVFQNEANDGDGLLVTPLIVLQHFGIRIGRWSFLGYATMSQRLMNANNILILNFQRFSLNITMTLVTLLSNDIIIALDILSKHSN